MMQAGPVQNTPVQASAQAEEYTPPPKED